jgi:hypothetical protein
MKIDSAGRETSRAEKNRPTQRSGVTVGEDINREQMQG